MDLTDVYKRGEALLRERPIGISLDAVETGFVVVHNRKVLDRFTFRQQCIDVKAASTDCEVLGVRLATPVIMSPMTNPIQFIVDDGVMVVGRALREAGSLMWTGTPIPKNLKELVDLGVPIAANVKPFSTRGKLYESVEHVQEAGVRWIGIEIDVGQGTKIGDHMRAVDCAPLSTKELVEIRKRVSVPLILKGVLSATDAAKAVDIGADGLFVSNHGGHTLDYLPHPLQVMDEIVRVADSKMAILVDGGFRRGSDVLKGLAFGASLVGLGRPILYGLAADGQEGVQMVVRTITDELRRLMTMVGASNPTEIGRDVLISD